MQTARHKKRPSLLRRMAATRVNIEFGRGGLALHDALDFGWAFIYLAPVQGEGVQHMMTPGSRLDARTSHCKTGLSVRG